MIYVDCDLCGADEPVIVAETGRSGLPVRTVICTRCGLVYTNPIRELADYQGEQAEQMRRLMRPASRPSGKYLAKSGRRAAAAAELLKGFVVQSTRALDVGCAAGRLVEELQRRNAVVVGVEPEASFAEYTRESTGCEVYECLLEDAPLADGAFDLVTVSHVLEHTSSPTAFLQRVYALLREGGHVFVEVPNVLEPRCSLRRMFHVAHRYNFSPTTLALLLRKVGFEVVTTRELTGPGTVQLIGVRSGGSAEIDWNAEGEDHRAVLRRLRRHRYLYYLTGQFAVRKLRGS